MLSVIETQIAPPALRPVDDETHVVETRGWSDYEAHVLFVDDAYRMLAIVRDQFGLHSVRYQNLARLYRDIADALGCRRTLEQAVRRLPPS